MKKEHAYALFEQMIITAEKNLISFTKNSKLTTERKADKSIVTDCDKYIDTDLTKIANNAGLQVVSEEGVHVLEIVKSGNYMTIDPIDGTLGYLEYVNYALKNGELDTFLQEDLGADSDFCLLLGIVENGIPQFGAVYNYITKEKILIDGNDKNNLVRIHNKRNYQQKFAVYVDQRSGDKIEQQLTKMSDVSVIKQATLGLKSIYTILNPHESAVTVHRVQTAGLWDIMPAAVATRQFGGQVFDDIGNPLDCTAYIKLPGKGATVIKGSKFTYVIGKLQR